MALFDSDNPKTDQYPQQNQYLQGNPGVSPNANTCWTRPASGNTGVNGNANPARQASPLPSETNNGTMLGSMSSGGGGISNSVMPSFNRPPSQDELRQYAQGRGGQFTDSSLGYWSNPSKWNELMQRGRELQPGTDGSWYANKFLSNAEEFTGGAHQTAMNMWGFDPAQQGGSGNGNMQLLALLQSLLGGNKGSIPDRGYANKYDPHANQPLSYTNSVSPVNKGLLGT